VEIVPIRSAELPERTTRDTLKSVFVTSLACGAVAGGEGGCCVTRGGDLAAGGSLQAARPIVVAQIESIARVPEKVAMTHERLEVVHRRLERRIESTFICSISLAESGRMSKSLR
jgi:hypothetical protein